MIEAEEKEVERIKLLAQNALDAHEAFNTSMATFSASILTVSITGISIFIDEISNVNSLILAWTCYALILIIVALYSATYLSLRRMSHDNEKTIYQIDNKTISNNQVKYIHLMYKFRWFVKLPIRLEKVIKHSHWIIVVLFIVGMVCLMVFTIGNLKTGENRGDLKQQEKMLDIEIKRLQLEELKSKREVTTPLGLPESQEN